MMKSSSVCAPRSILSTELPFIHVSFTDFLFATAWALICQMSSGGKLIGVDWDEVQSQIEAPSKHAA
jgi:hypothetical protein